MSPPNETTVDEAVIDAIAALDNRTRLEILLTLAETQRERQEQWLTMSFTELYDAVDLESTSQFSYHLDELVGPFVAETPEGYRLTYGGDKVVRTILSGVYESTDSFDDVAVDGVCVFCESSSLVATVEEEWFVVRCRACESILLNDVLPRSQTRQRSPAAVVDSAGYRIWGTYALVRGSLCPECYGPIDTTVGTHDAPGDPHDAGGRPLHTLEHTCRECWLTVHMPIEVTAAFHPAAVGFFQEHGISLPDVPLWEFFEFLVTGTVRTDVASVDPLEATVGITFEGETLRLAVDDSGTATLVTDSNVFE